MIIIAALIVLIGLVMLTLYNISELFGPNSDGDERFMGGLFVLFLSASIYVHYYTVDSNSKYSAAERSRVEAIEFKEAQDKYDKEKAKEKAEEDAHLKKIIDEAVRKALTKEVTNQ